MERSPHSARPLPGPPATSGSTLAASTTVVLQPPRPAPRVASVEWSRRQPARLRRAARARPAARGCERRSRPRCPPRTQRRGHRGRDRLSHPRAAGRARAARRRAGGHRRPLHRRDPRRGPRRLASTVVEAASVLPDVVGGPGRGRGVWRSLHVSSGSIVAWCDTDVTNFGSAVRRRAPRSVARRAGPALRQGLLPTTASGTGGDGGGRVTELVARPPSVAPAPRPDVGGCNRWSGEYAGRRVALEQVPFVCGLRRRDRPAHRPRRPLRRLRDGAGRPGHPPPSQSTPGATSARR